MKKMIWMVALSLVVAPLLFAADTTPLPNETHSAPAVQPSTATPSVIDTGESKSLPTPTAITTSSGVFVTLTRTAISDDHLPANVEIIRPEDFQKYNAQTAGDVVDRATSVQIPSQGRLGSLQLAGIRGATSNQTLVMVDGRPVGGVALSASQDLAEIPVEQIDHVEIVRGGVSALYGPNALGGVINVITKRATYNGLPISHISYESGSYGRQIYRLDFGSRTGPLDYYFFGDQQWESGFRDNSDARTHNIGGNIGLSMGKAGKLLFDISGYHGDAGVPGQLFPNLPTNQFNGSVEKTPSSPNARQVTDTNYIRTSYLLPLPMNSLMALRFFGSEREVTYMNPDFATNSDRHEQSKGTDVQFTLPAGFLVGGSFVHDRLDSDDETTPTNNYIASVDNWGIFAQENYQWRMLTLIPSGRFDHNSVVGDSKNPRIQLLADATPWLRFSGSAGRSFRAPTIDDLKTPLEDFGGGFSYQGNPNLQPEKAWTYDAGFEVHVDSYSFKADYFRSNISNLIQTTSDAAATTVNVGKARRQGLELMINHVVNRHFKDSWNYTYLQSVGVPLGFTDYVPLRLSPRHTLNYLASVSPTEKLHIDSTVKFVSSQYESNNDGNIPTDPFADPTKIGSYVLWGMRVAYEVRQLEFFLGVDDITDKRYEERSGYPLAGTTAYGGIKLRLWG